MNKILFHLSALFGVILIAFIVSIISSWLLSIMWNYFAPELFNAPIISHKQMFIMLLFGWVVKIYFTTSYKINYNK